MRLVFLGTSAAHPTKDRGLSCVCLEREGEILMFDAGEAAQMAFMRSGLGWNKKMKILVTHLHGDHCIGILGLLQTMSLHRRTEKIEIFGPAGIEEFISANILSFGCIILAPSFFAIFVASFGVLPEITDMFNIGSYLDGYLKF